MPSWVLSFNKRIGNRIQGTWAPYLVPWAVVHHVGRKSGTRYESPVMAFREGSHLCINLVYGSDAQWVKNVLAADGAEIVRAGKKITVKNPRVVLREEYDGKLPLGARMTGRQTGVLVLDIA